MILDKAEFELMQANVERTARADELVSVREHFRELKRERNQRPVKDFMAKLKLPEGSSILEVGAGSGASFEFYLPQYKYTVGDAMPECLVVMREHLPLGIEVDIKWHNTSQLGCADNAYDAAFCVWYLDSEKDPLEMFREMQRVVRPGGIVAFIEKDSKGQGILRPGIKWPSRFFSKRYPIFKRNAYAGNDGRGNQMRLGSKSKQLLYMFRN